MDAFRVAADRLESGTPRDRELAAERARFGASVWGEPPGPRAYERQDSDAYRFTVLSDTGAVTYELVGVEGAWLR